MPKRDKVHDHVKNALTKDGWLITHDPFSLKIGKRDFFIDLGAERMLAAEKENKKIAVEVKGFEGESPVNDFHQAIGQFLNYEAVLLEKAPERMLFLAVPTQIYQTFFQEELAQIVLKRYQIHLLVYDKTTEEIALWINA